MVLGEVVSEGAVLEEVVSEGAVLGEVVSEGAVLGEVVILFNGVAVLPLTVPVVFQVLLVCNQ